jgi:dTDP-4-dehydrorhamnose reductase
MVCWGLTDRLEVTKELISLLGLENDITITEVTSTHFASEYFAPRPDCERLVNKKLTLRKVNIMQDWKDALKEYLETYFDYLLIKNDTNK